MLMGEALVFVLLVEGSFAMRANTATSSTEVAASGQIKDVELLSYNIMLDFCLQTKNLVAGSNMSDPTAMQGLISNLSAWKDTVTQFVDERGYSVNITFSGLDVEPYNGQSYDKFQMGYIGVTGNEKWHLSGTVIVNVTEDWISEDAVYNISIIC